MTEQLQKQLSIVEATAKHQCYFKPRPHKPGKVSIRRISATLLVAINGRCLKDTQLIGYFNARTLPSPSAVATSMSFVT